MAAINWQPASQALRIGDPQSQWRINSQKKHCNSWRSVPHVQMHLHNERLQNTTVIEGETSRWNCLSIHIQTMHVCMYSCTCVCSNTAIKQSGKQVCRQVVGYGGMEAHVHIYKQIQMHIYTSLDVDTDVTLTQV